MGFLLDCARADGWGSCHGAETKKVFRSLDNSTLELRAEAVYRSVTEPSAVARDAGGGLIKKAESFKSLKDPALPRGVLYGRLNPSGIST